MSTDSSPAKWALPPHTLAKHQILRSYLNGWFPVLGSTHGRIVFLDGFAGRGRYTDGSPGSPIIAMNLLLSHAYFPRLSQREFVFLFVEHDAANVQSLRQEISTFVAQHQPWPTNVKWEVIEDKFESVADDMIKDLRARQASMAPLFAFIDPFGFQGLPLAKLAELTSWPRAELCINFAANNINRFLFNDDVQQHIEELFGCPREEIIEGFYGDGVRLPHLREVYAERLRTVTGLQYVQSFEMRNSSGNVSYFLFHATSNPKGVSLMKTAMWKVDPGGGFTFSDRLAGQDVLFTPEPDLKPLHDHLTNTYGGQGPVLAGVVKQNIELYTPYRTPHGTTVLRAMETAGTLLPDRSAGGRRGTFGERTPLTFVAAPQPHTPETDPPAQDGAEQTAEARPQPSIAPFADPPGAPLALELPAAYEGGGGYMGTAAKMLATDDDLRELVKEYLDSMDFEEDISTDRDDSYAHWQEQQQTVEVTVDDLGVNDEYDESATVSFSATLEIRRDLTGPNDSGDGLDRVTEVQRATVTGSITVSVEAEIAEWDDPEYETH